MIRVGKTLLRRWSQNSHSWCWQLPRFGLQHVVSIMQVKFGRCSWNVQISMNFQNRTTPIAHWLLKVFEVQCFFNYAPDSASVPKAQWHIGQPRVQSCHGKLLRCQQLSHAPPIPICNREYYVRLLTKCLNSFRIETPDVWMQAPKTHTVAPERIVQSQLHGHRFRCAM
jgi:hypothetical protein